MNAVAEHIVDYLLAASALAAVLTSLAWWITRVVRFRAPVYPHMIWLHTLIGLLVLPALWLHGPKITMEILPTPTQSTEVVDSSQDSSAPVQSTEATLMETSSPGSISPAESVTPSSPLFPRKAVLAAFWLVGFLLMLLRLLVDWYRLRRVLLLSEPFGPNKAAGEFSDWTLKVSLTSELDSPVCFGLFRPAVLLPKQIVETSTDEELRMVLTHEAAHVRRGDCFTNLLQRVIEAVFFFHPFVWYASSQLTQQRERVCDNYVLLQDGSATSYARLLLRIAEQGLEKNRRRAVALFEGRLLPRVRSLLDPKHNIQTKASRWARIISLVVISVCLVSSTVRLEAKSEQATTSENTRVNELGEAVEKRLTTYMDETVLALLDGETASMKVKENIGGVTEILITPHISDGGTQFDVVLLAGEGRVAEFASGLIHDGDSGRSGTSVSMSGEPVLCKIQLTPEHRDTTSVVVKVQALFTEKPTRAETEAMLLARGKGGRARLDFTTMGRAVAQFKAENGRYPETLEQLSRPMPKDVFSPTDADYHYEPSRKRFILSSCGEDGIYGNDDDVVFISFARGARSGQRHELYPLEVDENPEAQIEETDRRSQRPQGDCSISGYVVSVETGEPVDHATIYLFYAPTPAPIFIDVASDGSFIFENIPTGPFSLQTTRVAGFQDTFYNPEGASGPNPLFSLEEGEQRTGVLFELQQAFRISGKILDQNGKVPEGIETLMVTAWMKAEDGEKYESERARIHRQDGSYSIDGLSGKPAYVMAHDVSAAGEEKVRSPTYYPGTFSRNDASLVTFDEEWDVKGIDIQLQVSRGLVIAGTVTDEGGEPVPEAFVVVHRHDMLFDTVVAYTDRQGRYEIQGLGEGRFQLHVDASHRGLVRTRTPVDIEKGTAKTEIDFTLKRGATISGKLVDSEGDAWEIDLSHGRAQTKELLKNSPSFGRTVFGSKYGPKDIKGFTRCFFLLGEGDYERGDMIFPTPSTFIIQGMLPGTILLSFTPQKERQEVLKILYNSQDITETGLKTEPGQEMEDVIIIVGEP